MKCSFVRRLLPLHAGKDLPRWVGDRVDRHMDACDPCEGEFHALRAARATIRAGLRAAPEPRVETLGDNFWYAIRRQLRSEGLVRAPGEPAIRRARTIGLSREVAFRGLAAAAAVIVAAILFF